MRMASAFGRMASRRVQVLAVLLAPALFLPSQVSAIVDVYLNCTVETDAHFHAVTLERKYGIRSGERIELVIGHVGIPYMPVTITTPSGTTIDAEDIYDDAEPAVCSSPDRTKDRPNNSVEFITDDIAVWRHRLETGEALFKALLRCEESKPK